MYIEEQQNIARQVMNNSHIVQCNKLNSGEPEYNMDNILNTFTTEKRMDLKKWRENKVNIDNITSATS